MARKYTQEEAAQYFKEQGYTLTSEYKGVDDKVTLLNKEGVKCWGSVSYIRGGHKPENSFPPKGQIDEWVADCVNKLGFTLKSGYVNAKTPLHLVHKETGREIFRTFDSIRRGHIDIENSKETIEEVRSKALELGFILLSTEYENSSTRLLWQDKSTGDKFRRAWKHLKSGHIVPTIWEDFQLEKENIASYEGLGYYLDMTEQEYKDRSGYLSGSNKKIVVNHKELDQPWVTTRHRFKEGALSRLNNTHRSSGELLVKSVLNAYHDINYIEQYTVWIKDSKHLFDFYLPEHNLFIEYDGVQHYLESSGYMKGKLRVLKNRDSEKNEYVRSVSGTIARIPYTVTTTKGVISSLQPLLGKPTKSVEILTGCIEKQVADYYLYHTTSETKSNYGLSISTIVGYFKRVYDMTKTEYIRKHPGIKK